MKGEEAEGMQKRKPYRFVGGKRVSSGSWKLVVVVVVGVSSLEWRNMRCFLHVEMGGIDRDRRGK